MQVPAGALHPAALQALSGDATLGFRKRVPTQVIPSLNLIPEDGESVEEEDARIRLFRMASDDESPVGAKEQTGQRTNPSMKAKLQATLGPLAEQRVLDAGVRRLHQELVLSRGDLDLLDLPKRPDGSLRVMQASFLRRLLRGDLEVKGCLESDISAAYLDLRHLSLEQLLSLKMLNLDFATASESHTAHSNFLEALEAQIAARLIAAPSATSDLGRRLLLVLGACTLLGEGWGSSSGHLPDCWALPIPPRGAALFRVSSLQVQTDMSQAQHFPARHFRKVQWPESPVAIVKDTSFGPCRARRFQWEITTVDPGVDVVAAANAASNASHAQNDLVKALAARVVKGSPLDALKEVPRPLRSKACWPPACRQPTRLPRKSLELTAGKVRQSLERRGSISPG